MERPAGISLCTIVKDEERVFADALSSVSGVVDEIVVVDTGSRDRTVEIALDAGAVVTRRAWTDDFAAARNAALALATRRWIFVLDADERLDPAGADELRAIGREPAGLDGRYVAIRNLSDAVAGASGGVTNAHVRLFPNDPRIRYVGAVHEHVALDGASTALPSRPTGIELVHLGYLEGIVRERDKVARNLRITRRVVAAAPGDPFAWYNLGMTLLLAGDEPGARDALERVRTLTASAPRGFRPQALVALGDIALRRGDVAEALQLADECLANVAGYPNAHDLRGRALAMLGRYEEARAAFRRAIAGGNGREHFVVDAEIAAWKAPLRIAQTYRDEGRFDEALRALDDALATAPTVQPLVLARAAVLEARGELEAAQVAYAGALVAYRDENAAWELAGFLVRHAPPARAGEALAASLGLAGPPAQAVLLAVAGAVAFGAGEAEAARDAARRARTLAPGRADGLLREAEARFGLPGYATAVTTNAPRPENTFFAPYPPKG